MKEYYKEDVDGKKKVVEQSNGVTVTILEEPSVEYIASHLDPTWVEPESRDYLAEIDDLKARIEKLELGK